MAVHKKIQGNHHCTWPDCTNNKGSGVFSMDYNVFQYGDDDMQLPSLVDSQKGNMLSVCFVFGITWPYSLLSHA
jgi:hypothetical protein